MWRLTGVGESSVDGFAMKLTPFGFVCRAQTFVKDALSLPPRGGGEWTTQRLVNFVEQTGTLQILLNPGTGAAKACAIVRSRTNGGPRDSGVQGWVEYPATDSREAFMLREGDADRAMEEIFDIVERVLARIPEWDNSGSFVRPEPPPRAFEPLIPEIQKPAEDTSAESAAAAAVADFPDTQSMVDSLLSPGNFDAPPEESPKPAAEEAGETETVEPPAAEEPAAEVEPAPAEEPEKPAKKTGRGRKAKG